MKMYATDAKVHAIISRTRLTIPPFRPQSGAQYSGETRLDVFRKIVNNFAVGRRVIE